MRIKKIYFNRMYNQWRGEPLYVEDGLDDDKLYIRIMDVPDYKEGAINTITADYKDLNDGTYTILGQMDFDKRLAIFKIPLSILSNSGIYEVVFSLSFNAKDKEGLLLKTPIQTFEIVDTIESDDEAIAQDPNYPILVDLINQLAEYKVDTSIFPTREEMMKTIEENLNKTSMEEILKEVQANGYITLDKLNTILRNYASKADLSGYAKESDLNKFVTNLKFIQELDKYVLKTSMGNYVLKETGKGLSTHDLTDELYEKLVNLDMSNGEVNIDLTEYQKQTDDRLTTKDKTIVGSINEIKNSIPIKTSQLQNDSGYLTEHQDLSDYATKSELHNHDNKDILDNITQEKIDSWDNKSDFSGSYNDLTDKPIIPTIPDIPTKVSQLENDSNYATESFVTDKIIEANLGGNIDLSEYAKSSDIPTKVSQLDNDSEYVTKTYVENFISTDVRNILLENTFIDCLNEIANSFISDTIVFGNYVKYFYILRGRIRNLSDYVDLPITINNKEYDNVSYISMINTEYNFLTTFIFSNEGALRIETPYTPILDDGGMYIGITITEIGNVHELKGSYNGEITECHTHTNKDILDTITSTMINNWNNKSDVTINDDINNISTTQTYSNSMIENRLTEVGADITVISDDLDSIDARVTYLEGEQTKIGSFDGSYDSLTNKPTIPTKTSELTNDSGFTTKKYVDDKVAGINASTITGLSTVATSGDYNDLTNKPTIPSEYTLPTASATQLGGVKIGVGLSINDGVLSANGGGTADSGYPRFINGTILAYVDEDNILERSEIQEGLIEALNYAGSCQSGVNTILPNEMDSRIKNLALALNNVLIELRKTINISGDIFIPGGAVSFNLYVSSEYTRISFFTLNKYYMVNCYLSENNSYYEEHSELMVYRSEVTDVVFSGSYDDLTNKPTIPTVTNDLTNALKSNYDTAYTHSQSAHAPSNAQKNSDITKAEIEAKLTGNITTHTHSQYLTSHQSLDGYVKTTDLSKVATTGNYNDLTNKPTIPTAYTHPSTHPTSMITGLSKVATSGSYNDLTNKPTIPTIPNSLPANGGNADTVNNFRLWKGTQAQYDAITTKDSNTIYMITE